MRGHIILSHGLESGPQASKVSALAAEAERLGWSSERPDYRDIDVGRDPTKIAQRIERLTQRCDVSPRPLILAGSSLGAFISGIASLEVRAAGLFLLAPPISVEGFPLRLNAARVQTTIIHGWNDELIPALDVVHWARPRRDRLILVDDSHRLSEHVPFLVEEFAAFLKRMQ